MPPEGRIEAFLILGFCFHGTHLITLSAITNNCLEDTNLVLATKLTTQESTKYVT